MIFSIFRTMLFMLLCGLSSTAVYADELASVHGVESDYTAWYALAPVLLILLIIALLYLLQKRRLNHLLHLEKFEKAKELSNLGSWAWNVQTNEMTWSDEVYRIFAEEPQSFEVTFDIFKSYIPKEFLPDLKQIIENSLETHESFTFDHLILTKDKNIRSVRETGHIQLNEDGEVSYVYGNVMDIGSMLQAQSALQENDRLTDLLKTYDKHVIASSTDINGIITYASSAFAEISGYGLDELIGEPQNIVRHEDTPSETFKVLWETIQAGKTWKGELKNRRKDGTEYWVDTTITPIFGNEHNITGYSSIRRDISYEKWVEKLHRSLREKSLELESLNRELEQRVAAAVHENKKKDDLIREQNKLASMGEMIGNIAHQWRQPLNALALLLQKQNIYAQRGMLTPQKIQENTEKGMLFVNKMSDTIDDFRDFFKPNKTKTLFNLKDTIKNTISLLDATLIHDNITLVKEIDSDCSIEGFQSEFSQVLLNIINNARDVLKEKKVQNAQIKLSLQVEGGSIVLQICDNGGGIKEENIDKVFQPYFTTKEEGKGTGIGLYMSKMIIEENMHGKLSVNNTEQGACFTISLLQDNDQPASQEGDE